MDITTACLILLVCAIGIDMLVFYCPAWFCSTPVYQRCEQCGKPAAAAFASFNVSCTSCGKKAAGRLPFAILMVVILSLFLGFSETAFFSPLLTPSRFVFLLLLVAVSAFDLNYQLIPNKILMLALLPAGIGIITGKLPIWEHMSATILIISIMCLLRWASKKFLGRIGVGAGDIKLLAVMALFMGWDILWISYGGFLLGGIFGIVGLYTGSLSRNSRIPMAPFLMCGFVLYYTTHPLWETLIT